MNTIFHSGQLDVEYDEERNNPLDEFDPNKVIPGTEHLWLNDRGETVYYDGTNDDEDYENMNEVPDELEDFYMDDTEDDIDMSLRI